MFGAYYFAQPYFADSPTFATVVVIPEPPGPTAAGGGADERKRPKKKRLTYQIAATADPLRPYASAVEVVPAWSPEAEHEHEDDEMMTALLAFAGSEW